MARFEVIKEVTDSLANIVRLEAKAQKYDVEVVTGPFDTDFFTGKKNRIAVYLYQIAIDHQQNETAAEAQVEVEKEDETGSYTILYPRPIILRLHYAVAASGKTPVEEQLTLSLALKAFFERPHLEKELRVGENLPDIDVAVDFEQDFEVEKQKLLCQSLGVSHHVLLGYRVVTEMQPERELRRTRRVERRQMAIYDKLRPPDGMGPDADRSRPKPAKK
jgi:hypothetical protein